VRYCLPCSEATGELVDRDCPALDRKREARDEARVQKAKRARAAVRKQAVARAERNAARRAERATAMLDAVGDLHAELLRLWPVACRLTARDDRRPQDPPVLAHRLGKAKGGFVSGHACYGAHRITMTVPEDADTAAAYGTLAHEVAHFMVAKGEKSHGPAFWIVLVALVKEAYDADADLSKQTRSWGRQVVIEQAIRDARTARGL
jgi:hypothetical protein